MSRAARVGAFVVITLSILAAGIFIIGSKRYLFTPTYQVRAQFDNVAGLDAGADVRIGGVHIGTVHGVQLPHRPGDRVTVVMNLNKSTHEIVKRDSVASIETEGVLGSKYLGIAFGTAGAGEVRDGDTLNSTPPLQMSDVIAKANVLLDTSQQALQNITAASANLSSITGKIDRGDGTVGALVNDKSLYQNLQHSTDSMKDTMTQAQSGVTSFRENMDALKQNFLLRGFFKRRGYQDASEIGKSDIAALPEASPVREFTYSVQHIFDKKESAKLKNEKSLQDAGQFLAANDFGAAVITVSSGATGDADKELQLSKARAMVVRDYLVQHFGFDDTQVKTMGMGKQQSEEKNAPWGTVRVLIYPDGTALTPAKKP